MDKDNCELACGLVSRSYISQGAQALARRHRQVKTLLSSRRWDNSWWGEFATSMLSTLSTGCQRRAGTRLQSKCSSRYHTSSHLISVDHMVI